MLSYDACEQSALSPSLSIYLLSLSHSRAPSLSLLHTHAFSLSLFLSLTLTIALPLTHCVGRDIKQKRRQEEMLSYEREDPEDVIKKEAKVCLGEFGLHSPVQNQALA